MSEAQQNSFVEQLVSMGFPEDQARIALNRTGYNVSSAVELLSSGRKLCNNKLKIVCCLFNLSDNVIRLQPG